MRVIGDFMSDSLDNWDEVYMENHAMNTLKNSSTRKTPIFLSDDKHLLCSKADGFIAKHLKSVTNPISVYADYVANSITEEIPAVE